MGRYQETDEAGALLATTDLHLSVKSLAKECMDLIGCRNDIDQSIAALPDDHDHMWHKLEAVLASLAAAIRRLAARPSETQADLNHKAAVLMTVLRREFAEALPPGQEALALSLSLAEDVHRLTPEVADGISPI
jgi:hypothetical protein